MAQSFTLAVHSFRTQPTPLDNRGIRTYNAVVPVRAIPEAFLEWMGVNAREPSLGGRVPKAIRDTLDNKPDWFVAYNRGLALLAAEVNYDNKNQQMTVVFDDKTQHGVFDGGHTLKVILDRRADGQADEGDEAHCRLEIMTGVPPDVITEVVEARNTSRQVASKSLLNLDGRFKPLKATLGPTLTKLISWKENEDAPIDVREVIALLTALDRTHYDDTRHPMVAYSGREACLKHFEASTECYAKLYPVARDILKLWQEIQATVPGQYNANEGGRFGRLKGCEPLRHERELPVLGSSTEYSFPNGYLYPIVAAFRSMLVETSGVYNWGKGLDPCNLVRSGLAAKIFSGPIVNSIRDYHNPNKTGKDTNVWALAYQLAENYYLKLP